MFHTFTAACVASVLSLLNMLLLSVVQAEARAQSPGHRSFLPSSWDSSFLFLYARGFRERFASFFPSPPLTVRWHLGSISSQLPTGSRVQNTFWISEFSGATVRFSSADPKRKSIGNLWRCFGWGVIPGTMLVRRNKNDGFTGGVNLLYWQLYQREEMYKIWCYHLSNLAIKTNLKLKTPFKGKSL